MYCHREIQWSPQNLSHGCSLHRRTFVPAMFHPFCLILSLWWMMVVVWWMEHRPVLLNRLPILHQMEVCIHLRHHHDNPNRLQNILYHPPHQGIHLPESGKFSRISHKLSPFVLIHIVCFTTHKCFAASEGWFCIVDLDIWVLKCYIFFLCSLYSTIIVYIQFCGRISWSNCMLFNLLCTVAFDLYVSVLNVWVLLQVNG